MEVWGVKGEVYWIPLRSDFLDHPKLVKFCKTIRIHSFFAQGHLVCLWFWTAREHVDGILGAESSELDEEITRACQFVNLSKGSLGQSLGMKKNREFVQALVDCCWLDRAKDGILSVHDWEEYSKIIKTAKRNLTPEQKVGFERFWKLQKRKINKNGCLNRWRVIYPDAELTERIIAAYQHQRDVWWANRDVETIPHPLTWLNQERWDDEQEEGTKKAKIVPIRPIAPGVGRGKHERAIRRDIIQ
jgi:hypothetical protein